jgi:hypothetical protein
MFAHDVPHPIGDPDDDEGGLVDDDEDDEEEDEDDEEPMQLRPAMRRRSTRVIFWYNQHIAAICEHLPKVARRKFRSFRQPDHRFLIFRARTTTPESLPRA